MVKVKLLTGRAGDGFSNSPGDVIEVSHEEAMRLIETRQAEPVTNSGSALSSIESATIDPPVKRKRGRPRKVQVQ